MILSYFEYLQTVSVATFPWAILQLLIWKMRVVCNIMVYRLFCFKMAKRKIIGWK